MTTATTVGVNVPSIIARLREREAALPDPRDAPSANEQAARWATRRELAATISTLMNAPADYAREDALLVELEADRAEVIAKFAEIEGAIADAPPWREHADARERDRRYDHLQHLRNQLRLLQEGRLLRAPEEAYETLGYLDRRIAEVRDGRDRVAAVLASALKTAEQLLQPGEVTSEQPA